MIVKIYEYFGDFERFWAAKNKANFIVQRSECCGLRVDSRLRGNDKQQISAFICVNQRLMRLKKQSQFILY